MCGVLATCGVLWEHPATTSVCRLVRQSPARVKGSKSVNEFEFDHFRFIRDLHSEFSHIPISQNEMDKLYDRFRWQDARVEAAISLVEALNTLETYLEVPCTIRSDEWGTALFIGRDVYVKWNEEHSYWQLGNLKDDR